MSIYTYSVPDMGGCCVDGVKKAFKNDILFKHAELEVSHLTHTVTLNLGDEDAFKLLKDRDVHTRVFQILDNVGFESKPLNIQAKPIESSHATKGALGLFFGAFLLLLPLYITSMPWVVAALLAAGSLAFTVSLGWPFYRHAYRGLLKNNWTMDTLFSISTGMILLVSIAALVVPGLPMMFEAGLLIFGFRHVGLAIEEAFTTKFAFSTRLQDDKKLPTHVMCEDGRMISRDDIKAGDIFRVYPGDFLPVDGAFVSGAGFTSNQYKQGSERLTALVCNEKLDAGTKLMSTSDGAPLLFKAHAAASGSFLAQEDARIIEAKFKRAKANPPPKPKTTAYMLQFFIPIVVAIAVISGVAVGVYFASWVLALQCAATVLVAACPCTFGLITPLVVQVGIHKLKKEAVTFQIPEHLEAAAAVDCVVFDLNGTLTEGEPKVQRYTDKKILALMATLEAGEPHAIASAIRNKTTDRVQGTRELISRERTGIHVKLDNVLYVLGNQRMMEQAGIVVDTPKLGSCENVVYLASNGVVMGHVVLEDKLRSEASSIVNALQKSGKNIRLCTGSDKATAYRYATALNIDVGHVYFDCEPDGANSKQGHVQALQKQGCTVSMIGDYANDASAIGMSDFGLAVAHTGGHVAAQEAASAVVHDDSLLSILQVFKIAERTVEHINQNLLFNLLYNTIAVLAPMGLLFGAGIMMSPAVGAGLMMLQTLLIFVNVLRYHMEETPEIRPEPISCATHSNTDIPGVRNGVRFADTHGYGLDPKIGLNRADNTVSDGLNEFESARFY